jgi:hypothetical protein
MCVKKANVSDTQGRDKGAQKSVFIIIHETNAKMANGEK